MAFSVFREPDMDAPSPVFDTLCRLSERPVPFEHYTSPRLWNDPHISKGMLEAHLDSSNDAASFPGDFIDRGVDWMCSRFGIGADMKICDFGCGPGLWTSRLARAGARVTGLDLSERSIAYAREAVAEEGLTIDYRLGDYLDYSTDERYDLITMIHGDFSVLGPEKRGDLQDIFHAILADGGRVLLDVDSMEVFRTTKETGLQHAWLPDGGFMSPEPHHQIRAVYKYEVESVIASRYTIIEAERTFEIFVWQQCYEVEAATSLFAGHGFRVVDICGDVAGAPYSQNARRLAVIAEKVS